jgi:hypothetical protein
VSCMSCSDKQMQLKMLWLSLWRLSLWVLKEQCYCWHSRFFTFARRIKDKVIVVALVRQEAVVIEWVKKCKQMA